MNIHSRALSVALLFALALLVRLPSAAGQDAIRDAINQAQAQRTAELERAGNGLLLAFDAKITAAGSDKEKLARFEKEKRACERAGTLPASPEMKTEVNKYLRARRAASNELIKAYRRGAQKYSTAGEGAKSSALDEEMKRFIADEKTALASLSKADDSGNAASNGDTAGMPVNPAIKPEVPAPDDLPDRPGVKLLEGHFDDVLAVAFSPDGTRLVSGGKDEKLVLWSVPDGKKIRELTAEGGKGATIDFVAFSPDGKHVLSGGEGSIQLWDVETGKPERQLKEPRIPRFYRAAYSPDGKLAVLSGGGQGIQVWDMVTFKVMFHHAEPRCDFHAVAFSPDGKYFAAETGGTRGGVYVWQSRSYKPFRFFSVPGAGGAYRTGDVAFSADGAQIAHCAATSNGHSVYLLSVKSGGVVFTQSAKEGPDATVSISPDGRYLLSTPGQVVLIWDLKTRQQLKRYRLPASGYAAAYSPNGRFLALAGTSPANSVVLVDLKKPTQP